MRCSPGVPRAPLQLTRVTAALRPPIELVGERAREHRTARFREAKAAVPARAHQLECLSNRRAYADAAVSRLILRRAYVGLLRGRAHLETGGPDEDGGPHPAA